MGSDGGDDSAGAACLRDRQRPFHQRRVHATRALGCAAVAAAGRSQPDGCRTRPAGRSRACRAPAEPSGVGAIGNRCDSAARAAAAVSVRARRTATAAERRSDTKRVRAGSTATGRVAMTMTPRNSKYKIQKSNTVAFAFAFCILPLAFLATGCKAEAEKSAEPALEVVQVGSENVVPVSKGTVVVGPIISGELKAEKEATVRAEVGGSMVEVAVLEAQAVQKGTLLGRIETRTLEDAKQSASSAVRSAENQLAVARREVERTEKLVSAGALAARDLDVVQNTVTSAEAQVADAKSRLASADRALGDTVIRSPFQGVVSKRTVNAGDVVSPGTELFTIIDPSSMRLEASVPSEDLSALRIGASVEFTVRGYGTAFHGRIERVAPQADA